MQTLTSALLVLLVLLSAAMEAAAKDPCSKDWLRFMVVNACGMDKRHTNRKKPSAAPPLREILEEVDEEFDNWRFGTVRSFDAEDDNYTPTLTSTSTKAPRTIARNKDPLSADKDQIVTKGFLTRLFEHPGQLVAEAWLGLVASEPKKVPRRRAIQNAISRCCSENCDEDAFEGVCD